MPNGHPGDDPPSPVVPQILAIPAVMVVVFVILAMSTKGVEVAATLLGGTSHRAVAIYGFAAVSTFLSLWLVVGAAFAYLNIGQQTKIKVITGFYTPETIADYFDQFWAGRDGFPALVKAYRERTPLTEPARAEALKQQFDAMFAQDFGIRMFVIPMALFLCAGAIVLFLGYAGGLGYAASLATSDKVSPTRPFGIQFDLVSVAAIFGAYTWVTSDAIVRSHQWTLHPSDLAWYALRMIIAVPLGQALAFAFPSTSSTAVAGVGAFVAFVGNMFSLGAITKALATAATRFNLPMNSGAEERDDLIIKLAGVDQDKADALAVEGVSTIGQLVAVDPIRVSIATGLPFEYILNLVNAALLWVFVGNALKQLAPLGIRGASDVLALDEDWTRADRIATALAALQTAAASLAAATQALTDAQAALAAAIASGQPAAVPAPLQQAQADAAAALATARQTRDDAVDQYLNAVAARPGMLPAQAAMMTALAVSAPSGPGLTSVGFDAIRARLKRSSYAQFIKKLLED